MWRWKTCPWEEEQRRKKWGWNWSWDHGPLQTWNIRSSPCVKTSRWFFTVFDVQNLFKYSQEKQICSSGFKDPLVPGQTHVTESNNQRYILQALIKEKDRRHWETQRLKVIFLQLKDRANQDLTQTSQGKTNEEFSFGLGFPWQWSIKEIQISCRK